MTPFPATRKKKRNLRVSSMVRMEKRKKKRGKKKYTVSPS